MAIGRWIGTGTADAGPCGQLRRAWDVWRKPPALPPRGAVLPRDLGPALGHVLLLERAGDGAVVRLAGQAVCDATGRDIRNLPLSDLFTPAAKMRLDAVLVALFDHPAALDMQVSLVADQPDAPLAARLLILPLARDPHRAAPAIACIDLPTLPRRTRLLTLGTVLRQPLGGAAHLRLVHSRG